MLLLCYKLYVLTVSKKRERKEAITKVICEMIKKLFISSTVE